MSEDYEVIDRTKEDCFPYKGYIFDRNGMHDGGDLIENRQQLLSWMRFIMPYPAKKGQEVMICDNMDMCSLHIKDRKLIFPPDKALEKRILR